MRTKRSLLICLLLVAGCSGQSTAPTDRPSFTLTPTASPTSTQGGGLPTAEPPQSEPPATLAPIFSDIVLSGKGNKVVRFSIPSSSIPIAVVTHRGSSNFVVESIDAAGSSIDLLVNTIGDYGGTVIFGIGADHPIAFKVQADGAWKIIVRSSTEAPIWDRSTTLKGIGDGVYLISPPGSGFATIDLTYRGDSNFIVMSYGTNGNDLLANEIGTFSGQGLLPDGAVILEVQANGGTWTAKAT